MSKRAFPVPFATLSLVFSFLIGCSNTNTALTLAPDNSDNIVNGEIVTTMTEARSSTVLLASIRKDNSASLCTGTLIADNLVLAAAHCAPKTNEKDTITIIGFGLNFMESFGSSRKYPFYQAIDIKVHEGYDATSKSVNNAPNDLAIFKFKGALPPEFKVRALPTSDFKVSATDTLEMVGYGNTSEIAQDSGTLRQTKLPADHITDVIHVKATDKNGLVDEGDIPAPGVILVKQPDTGVCTGDSGGPLYIKNTEGQWTYLGVTSMGIDVNPNALTPEKKTCHGVSLFVDIRQQLNWITATVKALNN
ncbi:MAG: S1 family peptidase [Bacillota bacterium]